MLKAISYKNLSGLNNLITIGVFEGDKTLSMVKAFDKELAALTSEILEKESFDGKFGKTVSFYWRSDGELSRVLVLGLGKKAGFSLEKIREANGKAVLFARASKVKSLTVLLKSFSLPKFKIKTLSEAIAESIELTLYKIENYKLKNQEKKKKESELLPSEIFLAAPEASEVRQIQAGVESGLKIAEGVKIARDLINSPSNKMNPEIFSKEVQRLGRDCGFKVEVLEKKDLVKEKMDALLAVAQGSHTPPKMVVATYKGKKAGAPICVVGKGVTFDAGGISLKPSKGMDQMKYDMAGGGAVVGIVVAAAKLKLPVKLIGIIPLTENMPGGGATKPGDVVSSASGLSIEVLNTDAEGRMILADALHYAKRFKPKAVYDLATLTGAVTVALGSRCLAAMGDSKLIKDVQKAGEVVNERVWELPMFKEYDDDVKSTIADVRNVGKGEAGTIIGAKFLEPFVGKAYPWVHLDIAGTAWVEKKAPCYCPKGARGIGVRLLIELLRNKNK